MNFFLCVCARCCWRLCMLTHLAFTCALWAGTSFIFIFIGRKLWCKWVEKWCRRHTLIPWPSLSGLSSEGFQGYHFSVMEEEAAQRGHQSVRRGQPPPPQLASHNFKVLGSCSLGWVVHLTATMSPLCGTVPDNQSLSISPFRASFKMALRLLNPVRQLQNCRGGVLD